MIGVVLAGIALACSLIMTAGGPGTVASGLNTILGPAGFVLAITTFVISRNQRSIQISILLIVTGMIFTVNAALFLGDFSIIVFPGPIIGVMLGIIILALGSKKFLLSARKKIAV